MCSQIWSAVELPKIFCCWAVGHTIDFSTSCEVWRVILSGEQAVNCKLERKRRWAKVQLSCGAGGGGRMEPVL